MTSLIGAAATLVDLLTVMLGFGLIVFVHELGHFLAARWAGIRVQAFAVGFGPALLSWRKGLGLRRGSSEASYKAMPEGVASRLGATEYRLNALPFGGYVKMLGQEDLNPDAVSDAADSYQNCPPWKRMVVISAGVVMNLIAAAGLFILVFLLGLTVSPPVVGPVDPAMPAARAVALNAEPLGVEGPGLLPGDEVVSVEGRPPRSFDDIGFAAVMAERGSAVGLEVRRPGVEGLLRFSIEPRASELTGGLLSLGIEPARSAVLAGQGPRQAGALRQRLAGLGLEGVGPGARLVSAGGQELGGAAGLAPVFAASGGAPVEVVFETPAGDRVSAAVEPRAELMTGLIPSPTADFERIEHLLGLRPVFRVERVGEEGAADGLAAGDVFARLGLVEFPSFGEGLRAIGESAGRDLDAVVLREGAGGSTERVRLTLTVNQNGIVGFTPGDTFEASGLVALPPAEIRDPLDEGERYERPAAASLIERPGTRIVSVNGEAVTSLAGARGALLRVTAGALASGEGAMVEVGLELPIGGGPRGVVGWGLSAGDVAALHGLGWESRLPVGLFELRQVESREANPVAAVTRGLHETKRIVVQTYLTFARLFQGTVRVEHLKGPVGIAHIGTLIAERGPVWLMFFFALISVNLAVINFLPLPIVDGGQFLMLVYEQLRGRPVPIGVQNAVTLAGLVMIGTVFLVVTFNDVRALLGL